MEKTSRIIPGAQSFGRSQQKCNLCEQVKGDVHTINYLDIKTGVMAKKNICNACSECLANDNVDAIAKLWDVSTKVAMKRLQGC